MFLRNLLKVVGVVERFGLRLRLAHTCAAVAPSTIKTSWRACRCPWNSTVQTLLVNKLAKTLGWPKSSQILISIKCYA